MIICLIASVLALTSPGTTPTWHMVVQGPNREISDIMMTLGAFSTATAKGTLPLGGRVVGARDFDGNGSLDILAQYDPDGAGPRPQGTFLWRFDGATRIGVTQLGGVQSGYTEPVGITDMNGDGNYEYLMWNPDTHYVKSFEVLKSAPYAGGERLILNGGRGSYSQVVGVSDMNADGQDDLLLQDPATKQLRYCYFNGTNPMRVSPVVSDEVPTSPIAGAVAALAPEWLYSSIILQSPDGIQPREIWVYQDTALTGRYGLIGDEAYRSWPIVALAP